MVENRGNIACVYTWKTRLADMLLKASILRHRSRENVFLFSNLWFKLANFYSKVDRCCCTRNWFSSGWNAPSDCIAIPVAVRMIFFTEEVYTMQPTAVPLPCLQCRRCTLSEYSRVMWFQKISIPLHGGTF